MFCPKCGTVNDEGNRFCHQCSAALPTSGTAGSAQGNAPRAATPAAQAATGSQKRRGNPIKGILLAVVLLVVAFFVYAALSPDNPAPGGADASAAAGSAQPTADEAQAKASDSDSKGAGDATADGSAADGAASDNTSGAADGQASASAEGGATTAASADAAEEVGDIRTMDVFDWNRASDEQKKKIAFACQLYWHVGGITGEPVDIDSMELAKKIDAAIGEQASVFDTACALYDIDPSQWQDEVN